MADFFHLSLPTRPLCTMGTNMLKETNLWFHYVRSLLKNTCVAKRRKKKNSHGGILGRQFDPRARVL